MNQVTQYQDDDDGFTGSLVSGRLIKGQLLRWNETNGWIDRDGLQPPKVMLAFATSEALQCWQGKKPIETITTKPLPNVNDLNEAVPKSEWEPGLDGKPKPPWQHQVIVYLIDPTSGGFFTYLNSTIGARIAVEQLREKVITMRALRGTRVVPVVKLMHRPMKTQFGMRNRPEFEIVGWRQMGEDGNAITGPWTPQLTGPVPESTSELKAESKPKTPGEQTLAGMREVKPVSTAEFVSDEIPW
jgi:hypothetical protein